MTLIDTQAGVGVLNIWVQDTMSRITTSGSSIAHIEIDGYTFNGTSGSSVIPSIGNIFIKPLISSNVVFPLADQRNTPFEIGFSVQDKSGPYTPRLLYETSSSQIGQAVVFDHLYLLYGYNIHKISSIDATSSVLKIGGADTGIAYERMTLYDENTAYVSYEDSSLVMYLSKIDLCGGGEEVIYSWDAEQDSGNDYVSAPLFIVKGAYNGEEVIVHTEVWFTDTEGYKLHVVIYSITNDTITDLPLERLNDSYTLAWFLTFHTPPSFHQNKIVFTAGPEDWEGTTPSPEPTTCITPAFVIDITNKTLTKIDDLTVDTSTVWPFIVWGSGIDRDTGYYYFWLEDYKADNTGALARVDLSSNTTTIVEEDIADIDIEILQGDISVYGRETPAGTDPTTLVSIPARTTLATISSDADSSNAIIDEKNSLVWAFDISNERLLGYSIDGGSDIIYSISGGSLFKYALSRGALFILLAGKFFVRIDSFQITPSIQNQRDWYVLNFNVDCLP